MAAITEAGSSSSKGQTSEPAVSREPAASGTGYSLRYGPPWADPPETRGPARRLRGRLVLPVTLWLAQSQRTGGADLVGLTVSSVLLGEGQPPVLAGLLGPSTELAGQLGEPAARFVVHVLNSSHRRLAQHFAGELPAPPEMLEWEPSAHGPLLLLAQDRARCTVSSTRSFGWSVLVEATVDEVELGGRPTGIAWWQGGFRTIS